MRLYAESSAVLAWLFGEELGAHVRRMTGRDNMHIWAGECHVHAGINGDELAAHARSHEKNLLMFECNDRAPAGAVFLERIGARQKEAVR